MNRITLTGNIAKDVEIRSTETLEILKSSIAVNRSYKNMNGEYETDFLDFVIMKPTDYQKENLRKGVRVLIDGEVRVNSYEDKNKIKRKDYEVRVNRIEILTKPKQAEANEFSTMHTKTDYKQSVEITDQDIEEAFETPF